VQQWDYQTAMRLHDDLIKQVEGIPNLLIEPSQGKLAQMRHKEFFFNYTVG